MGVCTLLLVAILQQAPSLVVRVHVTSDGRPIADARVVIDGKTARTALDGRVAVEVPAGAVAITVVKGGFNPQTIVATAAEGAEQTVEVMLEPQTAIEEHVTISATRTNRGLEDQPMRVEVLDAEEIDEKLMMTPG